jgi:hypothetical protein
MFRTRAALFVGLAAAAPAGIRAQEAPAGAPPVLRFYEGGEELLPLVLPERYGLEPGLVAEDADWAAERSEPLLEWWDREGALLLRRITDYAGFEWPHREVEVHLVRYWPVISIEYPLVVAVGAIRGAGREVPVPDDVDFLILVLAHQVTHRLLDLPPKRDPAVARPAAREHRFLLPGDFESEAMVNWVVYQALRDVWGEARLAAATDRDLWQAYNPNHEYVMELMERWPLSRTRPLRAWLDAHPPDSEPFRTRDRYRRETEARVPPPEAARRQQITGTEYGIDLGETYDGDVFVAFVDEGSPAHRAGALQGDALLTIDGRSAGDVVEAQERMTRSWEERGEVHLSVRRGGREVFLTVERF